jgi:hypothetical protein
MRRYVRPGPLGDIAVDDPERAGVIRPDAGWQPSGSARNRGAGYPEVHEYNCAHEV